MRSRLWRVLCAASVRQHTITHSLVKQSTSRAYTYSMRVAGGYMASSSVSGRATTGSGGGCSRRRGGCRSGRAATSPSFAKMMWCLELPLLDALRLGVWCIVFCSWLLASHLVKKMNWFWLSGPLKLLVRWGFDYALLSRGEACTNVRLQTFHRPV